MEITLGRGRIGGWAALLVAAALICAILGYAAGLINTLGYEQRHVTYSGFASSGGSGGGLGLKHMVFFEGQEVFVVYDATVRKGALRIGLLETFGEIGKKPHFVKSLKESGSGEIVFKVPKTSLYSVYFDGSVLGDGQGGGYDIDYNVRWGTRGT
ncbi:MAG: hypothetical protein AAF495_12525 [Pseudomonadota bacterium]